MISKTIVLISSLLLCVPTFGLEIGPDEAIVLLKVQNNSEGIPDIQRMTFNLINGRGRLMVKAGDKNHYHVVPAGSYYLQSLKTVYSNVGTMHNKKPKDSSGVLNILPGMVVYIGEWSISKPDKQRPLYYKVATSYNPKVLIQYLNDYPELRNFPLAISYDNGNTVSIEVKYQKSE